MALFAIGLRTTGVASGAAGLEIRAHAGRMTKVHQFEICLAAATASTFGIGRPAAAGTTGTANVPSSMDVDDAAVYGGVIVLAGWGVAPTAPTSFLRRIAMPATIGSQYRLERTIEIARGTSLVLWNLAANGVSDVNLVIEDVGL